MVEHKMRYRAKCIKAVLPLIDKYKLYFTVMALANMILLAVKMIQPQIYKCYINQVVIGGQTEKIVFVVIAYFSFFLVKAGIDYFCFFVKTSFSNTLMLKLKKIVLTNLFSVEYITYATLDTGEYKTRIEDDTKHIMAFIDSQSIGFIFSFINLILSFILMISVDWRMAFFAIVSIPTTVIIDNLLSKREKKLTSANRLNEKNMVMWLHDSLRGWREIRALGIEQYQEGKYHNFLYNYARYYSKRINYWVARVLVIPRIKDKLIMQFMMYFWGGLRIIHGKMTIGDLLVAVMYYETMALAAKRIATLDADLNVNMVHIEKILREIRNSAKQSKLPAFNQSCETIECCNVQFSYHNSKENVLDSINLRINSGDRVAIVGKSGCGKTTLLKIITGMVRPTEGKVLINGVDLSTYDIDSFQKHIGFIMQESILFNCSIRENLLYGKENATPDELVDACVKANILDFINGLPLKFDTIIGERGIKLSGGQRQRLILARLYLNTLDVYILDEATSNIDVSNENIILDQLREFAQDKIIIIVTHRRSSVGWCNKIIDLEK